ncbi:MAG TPA: hypothetical protein VGV92_07405 [Gammaproteobacteria bacterium]|nr:hypothetical protein [Gammaproteobacteria bacterium]
MSIENDPRSTAVPLLPSDVWILISKHAEITDFLNLRRSCYALYYHERISHAFENRLRLKWLNDNENSFNEDQFPHLNKIWNHCVQLARESHDAKSTLAKIFHHIAAREIIPDEDDNENREVISAINEFISQDSVGVDILADSLQLLNEKTTPHYPVTNIERRETTLSCTKLLLRLAGFGFGGLTTCSGILIRTVSPPSDFIYGNILLTVGSALVGSGAVIEIAGNHRVRNWCRAKFFQPAQPVVDEESPLIPENDNGNRL